MVFAPAKATNYEPIAPTLNNHPNPWYKKDVTNHQGVNRMSTPLFQVLRAILVAFVGAVATVIIRRFDKFNNEDQPYDDF